jgi:DNA-binding MarR family transcriptional regulator
MTAESGEILLKFSGVCHKLDLITYKNFNLTAGELHCLIALYIDKPCCVKELSEITGTRGTTTSKILNSLQKKFIIGRELDEKDKRIERVFLTSAGKEFTRRVISFYKNKFLSISGFADEKQLDSFFDFLNQLSLEAEKSPELHSDLFLT